MINAAGPSDYIVSTYREHAHALVRGMPAREVMAELFGRATGMAGGMGGSMHMFDRERRFMGGYGIVGETCPIAIGIAYAVLMRGLPETVICFFGDGAVNQGTFHESLNMAGLLAAADPVRLREQPLCDRHRHSSPFRGAGSLPARRRLQHPGGKDRRHGRAQGL